MLAAGDGEDGFIRAGDLAQLGLGADLVVLSARRSGGGPVIGGEGVQSFGAPHLAAGARAVVATYWEVGDAAAARAMAHFYDALGRGRSADEALREMQRRLRRDGAPAREWSAFAVVGDGGVRPVARRRSWIARLFGR